MAWRDWVRTVEVLGTLQPFTINSVLPQIALPRPTTDGEAGVFSLNLNLTSQTVDDWRAEAAYTSTGWPNMGR